MKEETRIAVVEIGLLRETIRAVIREELDKQAAPSPTTETEYKDTDKLSISQAAKYLGVSTKTIGNYRTARKIPEPEYNLSGKPRWRVAQLKEAKNGRKAKLKFPVS